MTTKLREIIAATHTPFTSEGNLNLQVVAEQAEHLSRSGVGTAFIGGTTGESQSMTLEERRLLAEEWASAVKGTPLKVIIHVGANCLEDARLLARQAEQLQAFAIAAIAPSYFKPQTLGTLIECCRVIALEAPSIPFYYYDIPPLTGINLGMPEFLEVAAEKIPTLAGIKFSNPDLHAFQRCLRSGGGRFDILWGIDQYLLAAMALGAEGGVGSSYNFAAAIYLGMMDAFKTGDLAAARKGQFQAAQVIQVLNDFGYMAAAKAVMGMLGIPVGPPRLPNPSLGPGCEKELQARLEKLGFFDWIRAEPCCPR
jgi:N-acetylneuraminate lyase